MTEPTPYPDAGWGSPRQWPAKVNFFLGNWSEWFRRWCYRQIIDFRFRNSVRYTILWKNPLIIYAFATRVELLGPLPKGSLLLVALDWTNEDPEMRMRNVSKLKRHFLASGNTRVLVLTNTKREAELFVADGIEAIHLNHNAFIDERIFRFQPGAAKSYDAIYDAALVPYKRHYLASQVANLALISYRDRPSPDVAYGHQMRKLLSGAIWLNDPTSRNYRRLGTAEVNTALNASRVGLCLSEREGAMYASVQYLLCGIPVVTTPSVGGRDEFFEPAFALTVPPTPGAVAAGIQEMGSRRLDPEAIREATVARMQRLRRVFVAEIQRHLESQGVVADFQAHFDKVFYHTLVRYRSAKDRANEAS